MSTGPSFGEWEVGSPECSDLNGSDALSENNSHESVAGEL